MKPNIEDMHPWLHDAYQMWKAKMDAAGIPFTITCVLRTPAEQEALYAQGRQPIEEVNRLRRIAGMSELHAKDNLYKVTWTRNSKHFPGKGGKGRAFDFAILKPNKKEITWDTKWDMDMDGIPEYLEAANFAKEVGLESGAFWRSPDFPHIQLLRNPDA